MCQVDFEEGESCLDCKKCDSGFHVRCLNTWLLRAETCPCCRAKPDIPALLPAPSPRTMESLSAERQEKVQKLMALTGIEDVDARVILQENDWQLETDNTNGSKSHGSTDGWQLVTTEDHAAAGTALLHASTAASAASPASPGASLDGTMEVADYQARIFALEQALSVERNRVEHLREIAVCARRSLLRSLLRSPSWTAGSRARPRPLLVLHLSMRPLPRHPTGRGKRTTSAATTTEMTNSNQSSRLRQQMADRCANGSSATRRAWTFGATSCRRCLCAPAACFRGRGSAART